MLVLFSTARVIELELDVRKPHQHHVTLKCTLQQKGFPNLNVHCQAILILNVNLKTKCTEINVKHIFLSALLFKCDPCRY